MFEEFIKTSATRYNRDSDKKIMDSRKSRELSQKILESKLHNFKNRNEFLEHCQKRGYLKTEADADVLKNISKTLAFKRLMDTPLKPKRVNPYLEKFRKAYKEGKLTREANLKPL